MQADSVDLTERPPLLPRLGAQHHLAKDCMMLYP